MIYSDHDIDFYLFKKFRNSQKDYRNSQQKNLKT